MLKQIQLKQFVIIEQLTIHFKSGMTVITGETGAGKSIIIDALLLALGERLTGNVIRSTSDRAEIIVCFDIHNNLPAQQWLKSQDLLAGVDCIIRRIITHEGRSRCYINDTPVTLQTLQHLGSLLVNIHSQHEHQQLLKRETQRALLDDYAELTELSMQLKAYYQEIHTIKNKITELNHLNQDQVKKREFIQFQLQEFAKLKLGSNEIDLLTEEHKRLANADALLANGRSALQLLSESSDYNIRTLLAESLRHINFINQITGTLANCEKLIDSSLINIEEACAELESYLEKLELNPERFREIEQRLTTIHDLARKYRVNPHELVTIETQLQNELINIDNIDHKIEQLNIELTKLEKEYYSYAEQLSKKRHQAAEYLSQQITEKMQGLSMEQGKFHIAVETQQNNPRIFGFDQIEFLVTANQGQPLQPLFKIASGGELSRISLAIQVILSEKVATPIMIFDEVDVGISGKTADRVGRLLRELSNRVQVICITHLPQVAALGAHHLQVVKWSNDAQTQAQVYELSELEKIEELSRMLGGMQITDQTRAHAKEMLLLGSKN